jgi:hypothetical protein
MDRVTMPWKSLLSARPTALPPVNFEIKCTKTAVLVWPSPPASFGPDLTTQPSQGCTQPASQHKQPTGRSNLVSILSTSHPHPSLTKKN